MTHPVERVFRRVQHAVTWWRTTAPAVIQNGVQMVQAAANAWQTRDRTQVVQHYGFASMLPEGTRLVVLAGQGDMSNALAIGSVHLPSLPGITPGQSCLYDTSGSVIRANDDKTFSLICGGTNVGTLTSTGLTLTVPVTAPDFISSETEYTFNDHKHGAVQPGGGQTSPPDA